MERDYVTIVTPTGQTAAKRAKLAARKHGTLAGKRIGLLDNNKPNADRFLDSVGALLKQRYDGIELVAKRKMTRTGADGLQDFADRCDFVINAFAD